MTTLRSAIADELDQRAQEFMSRHEVSYLQALRAVLSEESHMSKYTTATAGAEVHSRAERYVEEHQGSTYREAVHAVLAADKLLAAAWAQPDTRRGRRMTTDAPARPAVPVPADAAEVQDWILRAITDGKADSLPGALGQLAIEAYAFQKLGMPAAEATRRAMGLFPHLVDMAKILLADVRRNAPESVPTGEDKPAQGNAAGFMVHARAVALQQKHPHMDYREAVGAALSEDPALKQRYAGVQS